MMFWGIKLENGKTYSQTAQESFHISMAALEPQAGDDKSKSVSVKLRHKDSDYLLCTLHQQKMLQQPLDLNFAEGENISFYINGKGVVHLSGYVVPFDDDNLEEEEGEESESDNEVPTLVPLKQNQPNKSAPNSILAGQKRKPDDKMVSGKIKQKKQEESDDDDLDDSNMSDEGSDDDEDISGDDDDDSDGYEDEDQLRDAVQKLINGKGKPETPKAAGVRKDSVGGKQKPGQQTPGKQQGGKTPGQQTPGKQGGKPGQQTPGKQQGGKTPNQQSANKQKPKTPQPGGTPQKVKTPAQQAVNGGAQQQSSKKRKNKRRRSRNKSGGGSSDATPVKA